MWYVGLGLLLETLGCAVRGSSHWGGVMQRTATHVCVGRLWPGCGACRGCMGWACVGMKCVVRVPMSAGKRDGVCAINGYGCWHSASVPWTMDANWAWCAMVEICRVLGVTLERG